ncbi:MAG: hypothetical protein ABI685_02550 [Ferruginibacter sp.]
MKTLLLFTLLFLSPKLYAQDSLQINRINSLVNGILYSKFPTQTDSSSQDYPATGLYIKKYTTIVTFGKELKEYAQVTKARHEEGQINKQSMGGSAFYYDQNKLIKVEEFLIDDGKENKAEWFFADDKCFYHTLESIKAEDRITLLLTLSNGFLQQVTGQH